MRRKNSRQAQDNNVTIVLIVVVIVFIICQMPALVTQLYHKSHTVLHGGDSSNVNASVTQSVVTYSVALHGMRR